MAALVSRRVSDKSSVLHQAAHLCSISAAGPFRLSLPLTVRRRRLLIDSIPHTVTLF